MAIPGGLLPHTVVRVRPVVATDSHGAETRDYAGGARVTLAPGGTNGGAWLQQDQRADGQTDGREAREQQWLLVCNYADITTGDRIEWADHPAGTMTFEVDGPPEPAYEPGGYHHTEATLRVVSG